METEFLGNHVGKEKKKKKKLKQLFGIEIDTIFVNDNKKKTMKIIVYERMYSTHIIN